MRLVKARKEHNCNKCGDLIEIGENCWQSLSFFGRFFCEWCYKPTYGAKYCDTTI